MIKWTYINYVNSLISNLCNRYVCNAGKHDNGVLLNPPMPAFRVRSREISQPFCGIYRRQAPFLSSSLGILRVNREQWCVPESSDASLPSCHFRSRSIDSVPVRFGDCVMKLAGRCLL